MCLSDWIPHLKHGQMLMVSAALLLDFSLQSLHGSHEVLRLHVHWMLPPRNKTLYATIVWQASLGRWVEPWIGGWAPVSGIRELSLEKPEESGVLKLEPLFPGTQKLCSDWEKVSGDWSLVSRSHV